MDKLNPCPKFGKSSYSPKCYARNGYCDEKHTTRMCPIKSNTKIAGKEKEFPEM